MSVFVVLGDADAAPKLVTATLNDYLDTHLAHTPDDDFVIVVAVRHPIKKSIAHVVSWCEKAGVYYEISASSEKYAAPDTAADCQHFDNFLIQSVEAGYAYGGSDTTVLALVGEEDPPVDVTRAIARAVDSHMDVRDLTEGALTYIKFYGDTVDEPPEENTTMAAEPEEEYTLSELIALADEGDEDAIEALTGPCEEAGIDPDEYATWAELEDALAEALGLTEDEEDVDPEEEDEDPEEDPEEDSGSGWTSEALKGKQLKQVREIAKAAGIANWKTATRIELVKELIAGTNDAAADEAPAPAKKATKKAAEVSDTDVEALADAIIDRLIARLS